MTSPGKKCELYLYLRDTGRMGGRYEISFNGDKRKVKETLFRGNIARFNTEHYGTSSSLHGISLLSRYE